MSARGGSLKRSISACLDVASKQGVWQLLRSLIQFKDFDNIGGTLKGIDKFGNRYYENKENIVGRQRWVQYPRVYERDASTVPAEWHGWLHSIVDETPVELPPEPLKYKLKHLPTATSNMGAQAFHLPKGYYKPDVQYDPRHTSSWRPGETGKMPEKIKVVKQHKDDDDWEALDRL